MKQRAERSLYYYAKAILGYDLLTPSLHHPFCNRLQNGPRHQMNLMPRDHLKTTCAMALCSWAFIQSAESNPFFPGKEGCDLRILYAGETAGIAQSRLGVIRRVFENNKWVRAFWPHRCWQDLSPKGVTWNQDAFTLPRHADYPEASVERNGIDGAITGHHYDIIIKDDLIGLKAANSSAEMGTAIFWNDSSYSLFDNPTVAWEFYFGTRWAAFDLYVDAQPKHTLDPYIRHIKEDGVIIFPERFNEAEIQHLERSLGDLFYLNYMNSVSGSHLTDFDMNLVRPCWVERDEISFTDTPEDDSLVDPYRRVEGKLPPNPPHGTELLFEDDIQPGTPVTPEVYRILRGRGGQGLALRTKAHQ